MQLFHFHRWSKWSLPVETYTSHKQQWRICKDCGKASFITLPWDKQSRLVEVDAALRYVKDNG